MHLCTIRHIKNKFGNVKKKHQKVKYRNIVKQKN